MQFDPRALEILADQVGVVSRRQLRDLGLKKGHIDGLIRRGHLRRVAHGTYLRTAAGRSHLQDALAACLRARHPARVTGLLILAMLGCEEYDADDAPFTILLSPGRRLVNVDFPTREDPAPDRDHARYGALQGTTPARTIFELAVELVDDEALLLAADRLRWRCRVGAAELARLAEALPDHPGTPRLQDLGLLHTARPETPGERNLAEVLAPLGLPIEWQVWLAPDLRVDALVVDCGLVVEHAGPTHHSDRDRAKDTVRDQRIRGLGHEVVHTTASDLQHPEVLRARILAIRERLLEQIRQRDTPGMPEVR